MESEEKFSSTARAKCAYVACNTNTLAKPRIHFWLSFLALKEFFFALQPETQECAISLVTHYVLWLDDGVCDVESPGQVHLASKHRGKANLKDIEGYRRPSDDIIIS